MKNILYSILIISLFAISCTDFLEEESKLTKTEDLVYSNADAVKGLVGACYSYTRLWYGHEMAIYYSEGGTDLWYGGKDNAFTPAQEFTTYNGLKADMMVFDQMFELLYSAINTCNTTEAVLKLKKYLSDAETNKLLSEVLFLRAFYYWHLVETWGPVQLNTEPTIVPSTVFVRNSVDQIYTQMFKDVQFAVNNLDPSEKPSSRVTWLAAKAFKARLALYYGSAYHGQTAYLDTAAVNAKDVINAAQALGKGLYDNYSDVWDIKKNATENNNEFIWAVDYYDAIGSDIKWSDLPIRLQGISGWDKVYSRTDGLGQGNTQHLMWTPIWNNQNTNDGGPSITDVLVRMSGSHLMYTVASPAAKVNVDLGNFYVKYSMGYTRFGPTKYCLDLFDETIDQRWDVTFRSAWYKDPKVVPKNYPDTATCAYPLMSTGTNFDTCLFFSKRPLTQAQKDWANKRYKAMDVTIQFDSTGRPTPNTAFGGAVMYNALRKFENTDSKIAAMTSFQDYFSYRDFPVFRLAEMYLIAAEALINSNQSEAVELVNILRDKRAIDGKEAEMLVNNVDVDFILEERAREFTAEDIRWFDLKRTKKLEQQVQKNPATKDFFIPGIHYLRPIPTNQIKASSNFDDPTLQNPGY
ncbi:MAG: RagB/SusD family nutrient uptake outer membrane protein [Bacteroidales bacterium]